MTQSGITHSHMYVQWLNQHSILCPRVDPAAPKNKCLIDSWLNQKLLTHTCIQWLNQHSILCPRVEPAAKRKQKSTRWNHDLFSHYSLTYVYNDSINILLCAQRSILRLKKKKRGHVGLMTPSSMTHSYMYNDSINILLCAHESILPPIKKRS